MSSGHYHPPTGSPFTHGGHMHAGSFLPSFPLEIKAKANRSLPTEDWGRECPPPASLESGWSGVIFKEKGQLFKAVWGEQAGVMHKEAEQSRKYYPCLCNCPLHVCHSIQHHAYATRVQLKQVTEVVSHWYWAQCGLQLVPSPTEVLTSWPAVQGDFIFS